MDQNTWYGSDVLHESSTCYHGKEGVRFYDQYVDRLNVRTITKKRMELRKQRVQNSQWFQNTSHYSGRKLGNARYVFKWAGGIGESQKNMAYEDSTRAHGVLQRFVLVRDLCFSQ